MRRVNLWIAGSTAAIAAAAALACIGDLPAPEGELTSDGQGPDARVDGEGVSDGGSMRVTPTDILVHTGDSLALTFVAGAGASTPTGVRLASPTGDYMLGPSTASGGTTTAQLKVNKEAPATVDLVFLSNNGARATLHLVVAGKAGALDPSFGVGGTLRIDVEGPGQLTHVVLEEDGHVLALGSRFVGRSRVLLLRSGMDGTLDTTFGGDGGVIITRYGAEDAAAADYGNGLALQQDNRFVVGAATEQGAAVARHLATGRIDPSFGVAGVNNSIGVRPGQTSTVGLQSSGAVIVAIRPTSNGQTDRLDVIRLSADGRRDPGFGDAGIASTARVPGGADLVAVQPDDRIIVAGTNVINSVFSLAIARYLPGGAADTTFGTEGATMTTFPGGATATSVAIGKDGRIYLVGFIPNVEGSKNVVLAAYLPDGKPDPGFGQANGTLVAQLAGEIASTAGALIVDREGRILVGGGAGGATGAKSLAICRFMPNGLLDARFGAGGCTLATPGADPNYANDFALDRYGRIIVAGAAGGEPFLARFWP